MLRYQTAQQIYVRDIQLGQPAPNCCMVDGVECVLEINIYHIESRPTLGGLLNDPVERLHLPLCADQASESFLGGIQQPVPLAEAVQPIIDHRRQ